MDYRIEYVDYLMRFIGRPYIWGGDGSGIKFGGFDCSGLVLEGLWAFGFLRVPDTTAYGIMKWAEKNCDKVAGPYEKGDLLFFGTATYTRHVAVAIDSYCMIEAGGGDSACKSSSTSTGMVRIRPIDSRKSDFFAAFRLK